MSHGKQFTLYSHVAAPNGWKVAVVLEELGLTYHPIYLDFDKNEQKSPEHIKYNPNGRIPTIIDHKNGDLVLWESCAILAYLVDKYDPEHKISASTEADKAKQLQWLFFQASGQGPYFGQYSWFTRYHPEKVPSAVERYRKEMERVLGVLDGVLAKQEWLVAGKPTVADLAFLQWTTGTFIYVEGNDFKTQFPAVNAWIEKLNERPSVKKCAADRPAPPQQAK